jgi:hypothetical protein
MAWWTSSSALLAATLAPALAHADPLRLRGDAFATAQAPAGLLSLEAADRARPWLDAEASVWFGAGDDTQANALIVVVKVRDPKHRGGLKLGRQIVLASALRPIHLDGLDAVARLPEHTSLEVFGGSPVEATGLVHDWDWVLGARAAQDIGKAQFGIAWLEQRDHGELATHELAADASAPIGERIDLGTGAALDLISVGLAELRVSGAWRSEDKKLRGEVFANRRAPAHLLPATSLFSVLGDVPATRTGVNGLWRAAPRLDVDGTLAIRIADPEPTDPGAVPVGASAREDLAAGAHLRLDDRGASALGLELRRQGAPDGGWTGARGSGRIALAPCWTTSAELELVRPDRSDRGSLWPWALGAVTWRHPGGWEVAGAVEASATAQYRSRVDVLVRLSRAFDADLESTAKPRATNPLAKRGVP